MKEIKKPTHVYNNFVTARPIFEPDHVTQQEIVFSVLYKSVS
jgi:hypothetical protein